jgi:hypothetical protein
VLVLHVARQLLERPVAAGADAGGDALLLAPQLTARLRVRALLLVQQRLRRGVLAALLGEPLLGRVVVDERVAERAVDLLALVAERSC